MKTILSSAVMFVLVSPAVADPLATYRIELAVPGTAQRYSILVSDHQCGESKVKSPSREHYLKVCAAPTDDKRVRLLLERRVRDQKEESESRASVITTVGASFDVMDGKLTIKTP